MARNLVLIGFMGTGKSHVGRVCAGRLGFGFRDSDKVIEARAGRPIPRLFAEEGEAVFRAKEREIIAELAATPSLVIATGGGAILDADNRVLLRENGVVCLLTAQPDAIMKRVRRRPSRPLLAGVKDLRGHIEQMLAAREPLYREAAHFTVDTTDRSPEEVAAEVLRIYTEQE